MMSIVVPTCILWVTIFLYNRLVENERKQPHYNGINLMTDKWFVILDIYIMLSKSYLRNMQIIYIYDAFDSIYKVSITQEDELNQVTCSFMIVT